MVASSGTRGFSPSATTKRKATPSLYARTSSVYAVLLSWCSMATFAPRQRLTRHGVAAVPRVGLVDFVRLRFAPRHSARQVHAVQVKANATARESDYCEIAPGIQAVASFSTRRNCTSPFGLASESSSAHAWSANAVISTTVNVRTAF